MTLGPKTGGGVDMSVDDRGIQSRLGEEQRERDLRVRGRVKGGKGGVQEAESGSVELNDDLMQFVCLENSFIQNLFI